MKLMQELLSLKKVDEGQDLVGRGLISVFNKRRDALEELVTRMSAILRPGSTFRSYVERVNGDMAIVNQMYELVNKVEDLLTDLGMDVDAAQMHAEPVTEDRELFDDDFDEAHKTIGAITKCLDEIVDLRPVLATKLNKLKIDLEPLSDLRMKVLAVREILSNISNDLNVHSHEKRARAGV